MSKSEPLQSKDVEQMLREEAIDRYIKGEKPAAICRALARSRPWFYRVRAGLMPPSRATVNRILLRHELVQPRPRGKVNRRLPDDYPWPDVQAPNDLHLFDFVLRAGAGLRRFYSSHLLDAWRRWPYLRLLEIKTADAAGAFLVAAWQEIGLPGALYIDNDVVWRGSSSAARTFSRIYDYVCFWGYR